MKRDQSIVVLPFVNMNPDVESDFFADGITEEIINALAQNRGLKVIARTSAFAYKGKNIDVRTIGEELGVKAVLEGSIRRGGDRIRVTAQLIETEEGMHLWSENFDRKMGDIFALQDEISLLIADYIRENFGHFDIEDHLVQQTTDSIKAYELYLNARYQQLMWSEESLHKATQLYEESMQYDPKFVRSYYGAVQSYGLLMIWGFLTEEQAMAKAGKYLLMAQDIDTSLPDYPMSFVGKSFWGDWEFDLAYQQLQQTLSLDPNYINALEAMAELFLANGHFDKAESYIDKMLEIDPMSANHYYTLGTICYIQRDFERAFENAEKSLRLQLGLSFAVELKAICLLWLKQYEAFSAFIPETSAPEKLELLYRVIHEEGFQLDQNQVEELSSIDTDQPQLMLYELYILANAGHEEAAVELLAKYVAQRRGQVLNFRYEPFCLPLQELEAFKALFPKQLSVEEEKDTVDPAPIPEKQPEANPQKKEELMHLLQNEQLYLNPELSLRSLADRLSLHPNRLSQIINDQFERNFNELINQFRLDYFKEIAHKDEFAHMTILGKAYESGFSSKTVFNSFFKRKIGVSPKEWMNA